MSESLVADALMAMTSGKDKYIVTIERRQQYNYTVDASDYEEAEAKAIQLAEDDNWADRPATHIGVDHFGIHQYTSAEIRECLEGLPCPINTSNLDSCALIEIGNSADEAKKDVMEHTGDADKAEIKWWEVLEKEALNKGATYYEDEVCSDGRTEDKPDI